MHARTHARTHAHTHARTHARTHTHTHLTYITSANTADQNEAGVRNILINKQQEKGNPPKGGPVAEDL